MKFIEDTQFEGLPEIVRRAHSSAKALRGLTHTRIIRSLLKEERGISSLRFIEVSRHFSQSHHRPIE
jgi:hypothetical protein